MASQDTAQYHILLIGIDSYPVRPLRGCVNDIDAVQRLLLGRLQIAPDRIRRLASPHPGAPHETVIADQPATLENLLAAFAELGSSKVAAGDRVFIYFSGHGVRVPVTADSKLFHREALVPVDFNADPSARRLLYDFTLNELLEKIVERTLSVTFVLDCCHSAGATRSAALADRLSRFLDPVADLAFSEPLPDPGPATRSALGDRDHRLGVENCHVVSACLGHEQAQEDRDSTGVRHGLLTRAFLTTLDGTDSALPSLPWTRIWQAMRADVKDNNPAQNAWMAGNPARFVFGGPPVDGDPGVPVSRRGDGYRIEAGVLEGITTGALIAIYGEQPAYFSPLGSPTDATERIGLIRVTAADRVGATAVAEGTFELPPGARGRLIASGTAARLRCAVEPAHPTVTAQFAESPLLELVAPAAADVRLVQRGDRWYVTDAVHGTGSDGPVLFSLTADQLGAARAVLEHYHAYAQPLRLADRASDLRGQLSLDVLSYPDGELAADEAQAGKLPEAPSRGRGSYTLQAGAKVCFRVRNGSQQRLRVTVMSASASGRVQMIGDHVIDAGAFHLFWARGNIGAAFSMSPPVGVEHCIDRMVAIGRTAMDHSLDHLRVDHRFADALDRPRGRDFDDGPSEPPPTDQWTAAQAIVETRRPRHPDGTP